MVDEKDPNEEEQEMIVTLTLDDGTEAERVVLTTFNAEEHECVAFLSMEGADLKEGETYLYRYSETEDGTSSLGNIEDGDECEIVAEASDELLDAQGYDELVGEIEEK